MWPGLEPAAEREGEGRRPLVSAIASRKLGGGLDGGIFNVEESQLTDLDTKLITVSVGC